MNLVNKPNDTKKHKLTQQITSLLSNPPSSLGYEGEIKIILDDLNWTQEDYLRICIVFLSRTNRTIEEIYLIIGYFFFMKGIIKLVKENDSNIIDYLQTIAKNMSFEKLEANRVVMRFGEKGKKAYIVLQGEITVLIQDEDRIMRVTENNYLYYLATWIYYKEYKIIESVLNDNYSRYPLEIIDDISPSNEEEDKDNVNDNNGWNNQSNSNVVFEEDDYKRNDTIRSANMSLTDRPRKKNAFWKLNPKNSALKASIRGIREFKASELLGLFPSISSDSNPNNMKYNHFNNTTSRKSEKEIWNQVTVDEYIDRWNVCKEVFRGEIIPKEEGMILNWNILNYKVVAQLPAGVLVGEVAWNESNKRRNATIITTQDCYFGTWNQKSYSASLKALTEKQLRNNMNFITSIKVFSGISFGVLSGKFKNFTILKTKKGIMLYNQGDALNYIYLLRQGVFEVTMRTTWKEWTEYIKYWYKWLEQTKKLEVFDITSSRSLHSFKDNFQFHKFYKTKEIIRITEIQCPELVGLTDFKNEFNEIGFNVECKSPTAEVFRLDANYYNQLREKDFTVKNNEEEYIRKKLEILLERLTTIRESKIKTFSDNTGDHDKINKMWYMEIAADNEKKMQLTRRFGAGKTVWGVKGKEYFIKNTYKKQKKNCSVNERRNIIAENYMKYKNNNNNYNTNINNNINKNERYCSSDNEALENKVNKKWDNRKAIEEDNSNKSFSRQLPNNTASSLSPPNKKYCSIVTESQYPFLSSQSETISIDQDKSDNHTVYTNNHINNIKLKNVTWTNEFLKKKCVLISNVKKNNINGSSLKSRQWKPYKDKYSIYREYNYFTDIKTEETMKDINTLILGSGNCSPSLGGGSNTKAKYYHTLSNFHSQINNNCIHHTNKKGRNISSAIQKTRINCIKKKQCSEIAFNDMVWENVQQKVKEPLSTSININDLTGSSRARKGKIIKEMSLKTAHNSSNISNNAMTESIGKTGFSTIYAKSYHNGSQKRKKALLREYINVIRLNNSGNKVADIKEYCDLKKQNYNENRKVYLNKVMNRFTLQYGLNTSNNKQSNK